MCALGASHHHKLFALICENLDSRHDIQRTARPQNVDDPTLDPLRVSHPDPLSRLIRHAENDRAAAGIVEGGDQFGEVRRSGHLTLELQRFTFPLAQQAFELLRRQDVAPLSFASSDRELKRWATTAKARRTTMPLEPALSTSTALSVNSVEG